ncbi:U3 small nucleolar RNA-interacting protein 2 [Vidua macroura]|uniref:U3 small nucleolar RNA-interacting protein 2 n=1 Tax=Vidua macroura TaxID=187451 RepID=UPI0023A866C7|nr:U3 small nucleolar RNA-interacting protein 2 [Vidua macroura]
MSIFTPSPPPQGVIHCVGALPPCPSSRDGAYRGHHQEDDEAGGAGQLLHLHDQDTDEAKAGFPNWPAFWALQFGPFRCVPAPGADGRARATAGRPADEEVSSDSETESPLLGRRRREVAEEEVEETPQEKKLRLAKQYLEELRQLEEERAEEEEELEPADLIGDRLKEDVLEQRGRLQRLVAKDVQPPDPARIRVLRGHQLPVTCLVISPDDRFIFSASKDGSLIKWEVDSGKRLCVVPGGKKGTEEQHMGHASQVLCMAISSDGKYLATGDRNKLIMIWDAATCKRLHIFRGHRDAVSGLSFRKGTHQLYSASHDRCVKVWDVAENAYVETLFGHQDIITGLDSLSRECCVTAGGRDGTVRLWKIPEESQLVFSGHQGSIDCIQLINEEHMVSGADDGSLALWGLTKKKPLALARQAHGEQDAQGLQQPYWISAVAALRNSDLLATGSHSGSVKLWKCGEGFRKVEHLLDIPLVGFVNSLKFSAAGDFLVAGIGQEHRLGRWWRIKEAKNSICIIPLKQKTTASSPESPGCPWTATVPGATGAGHSVPVAVPPIPDAATTVVSRM